MRRGFSLIELSIVLVILGLLVGGILAGQSLIRASELRALGNKLTQYRTATMAFRDKYFALPGDMLNATSFWGAFGAAGTGSCPSTPGTGTETCNGDGDGFIEEYTVEPFAYWKQLANAGLVEGRLSGAMPSPYVPAANSNVPLLPMGPTAGIRSFGYNNGPSHFGGNYNNVYEVGLASGGAVTAGLFIMPEELWNLDTKIDNGILVSGLVRTRKATSVPNCASDDTMNATYDLDYTGRSCAFLYSFN